MSEEKKTRKEAIALTYKQGQFDSPSVVAKGKGKVAENILAVQVNMMCRYMRIRILFNYLDN